MKAVSAATAAEKQMLRDHNRHPRGFWFIFWGELAERASFYGMKTLLLLYMVNIIGYSDATSGTVVNLFTACAYILPIVGGFIADHYLGKFKTIMYFALPYILGHVILGSFNTQVGLYVALLLLAGGSGTIKPNISTLMGLMYQKAGKSHLMTQAFSWFYMAINVGAFATTATLPFIRDRYGYGTAFMAPTLLMVVSLGIFFLGKKHYPMEDVRKVQRTIQTPQERSEDLRILGRLSGLFVLIVFFWSIFDQSATTWTLFARDYMTLEVNIFGWATRIPPDAIQAANPALIVIMTPLFAWLWSRTDTSETRRLPSPHKMLIGFFLVVLCMGLMCVAGFIGVSAKVSILWEALAYVLLTAAELCISVVGLQLAFEEAPDRMKSMITGIWLCTVFLGNLLAGLFVQVYDKLSPGGYFGVMTIMMVGVTVAFYFVGRRFVHSANGGGVKAAH